VDNLKKQGVVRDDVAARAAIYIQHTFLQQPA